MLAEPRTDGGAPTRARRRVTRPDLAAVTPDVWLVVAITAIGALLRFGTITHQSFWYDEATTVHEVGLPFGSMLHAVAHNEATPPLYFALAWIWTRIFGSGELGIRSLSALCGTAAIPVVYLAGRELAGRVAGVYGAALTAVSPFMIWYSQEARSYMLLGLLSGLSLLFWARCLRTRSPRDAVLWAVASALALATHFFAGLLVAPEALWLLWRARDRAVIWACVGIAAVQVALLPLLITDASHPLDEWISGLPLSSRIEQIPTDFGVSQLTRSSAISWGLPGAAILLVIVLLLLGLAGGTGRRRGAALAGGLAAVVILVPIFGAEVGHDYVFSRNLMPAWIPLAVVLGAACAAPRARLAGGVLAAVLVAGCVWAGAKIDGNPLYERPDWRGVATALGTATGPRAVVAYAGSAATAPLSIYLPGTDFSYNGVPPQRGPLALGEIDVVGSPYQVVSAHLPAGVRLLGQTTVNQYLVTRFALPAGTRWTAAQVTAEAPKLLGPAPAGAGSVLFQR